MFKDQTRTEKKIEKFRTYSDQDLQKFENLRPIRTDLAVRESLVLGSFQVFESPVSGIFQDPRTVKTTQTKFLRDRPKLFEIIFEFCSQQIMILQLLTSRLIPNFSKNSNKNLLFRHRKVFELRKMHF